MKLFYAHYPQLREGFLEYFIKHRTDPLEKWLVVCASSRLSESLRKGITCRTGALANVYFSTFSGLLRSLDMETPTEKLPLLPEDNFRNFILKELLNKQGVNRYVPSAGFLNALKSSLRDLSDSLADPAVLEEHLRTTTDSRLEQDMPHLQWLNVVYAEYLKQENKIKGYRSYQSYFENGLNQVPLSDWLKSFKKIIFYGFYDLTGRQLELFQQISSHYSVEVFAPYQSHPAYQFAKKFFETNLLGGTVAEEIKIDCESALGKAADGLFNQSESVDCPSLKIVNAANIEGEVFFATKEILRLTQEQGVSFSDIAVIARSIAPYQDVIRRSFAQNCIPLNAVRSYALSYYPLGIFCQNLFSLLNRNFNRESVLAVVTSPYFKVKNKWRFVIESSLVNRDYSQWMDLLTPKTKGYDAALLDWLARVKEQLEKLSLSQSWASACSSAQEFLSENLDEKILQGKEIEIYEKVKEVIAGLERYSSLRSQSTPDEFLQELNEALKNIFFNETEKTTFGVDFMDAVGVRGLQYKVVFVLGLNENVFPVSVKEDPILKDYYRYVLRDGLGYWINQKNERFSEEKLLFYTVVTAAREQLYISYCRLADNGKPAIPSVYLAELARVCNINLEQDALFLPDRFSALLAKQPLPFLTPKELSLELALSPREAMERYEEAGLSSENKKRSLRAAEVLNSLSVKGSYDGFIQSGEAVFERKNEKGFSASALQELGKCPMKYFLNRILDLGEREESLSRHILSPKDKGTLYHEILMDFYQYLKKNHLTHSLFDSAIQEYISLAVDKRLTAHSYKDYGIYPLVWELIKENIYEKLLEFIPKDMDSLEEFIPSIFEQAVSGELDVNKNLRLKIYGIIDRIDLDEKNKKYRIIDYKSGDKAGKDFVANMFKKMILQPFLYLELARQMQALKHLTPAGAYLLSINKGYSCKGLSAAEKDNLGELPDKFFTCLINLLRKGTFFIFPSDLCAYCSYTSVCRKNSFKALQRSRTYTAFKEWEDLLK